jgi:SET domain-containing protein
MVKKKRANTFIKPSTIHGLGLFAKRNIASGEEIIQGLADYSDPYRDEWIRYKKSGKRSFNFDQGYCMINHSKLPNTRRGLQRSIYAKHKICAGEEITEDYNRLPHAENPFLVHSLEKMMYESI